MTPASPKNSEWLTRKQLIDPKLKAAGWRVVPFDPGKSLAAYDGCAVEEFPTENGPADYALCVGGKVLGIVEAKKLTLGPQNVLTQAERYSKGANSNPLNFRGYRVPFLYSTNGEIIWHSDIRHPLSRSHTVAHFHNPEALAESLGRDPDESCQRLLRTPNDHPRLREYQREANAAIEKAIADRKRQMLVAMATGTGKTFTMVNQVYRLMKAGVAQRVLFLVDRRALAAQAVLAFASFEPEPGLKFDRIYEVYSQRFHREDFGEEEKYDPKVLPTSYLTHPQAGHAFVYVSTIQRMTINLFGRDAEAAAGGEEIDEDADQLNIPIHAFDLIIADECHRGYTSVETAIWRKTLDHFDAVRIGLTATPAAHTTSYFKEIVYRYEYERAVREGYLVDYDVVAVKSDVRMKGIFLKEGEEVGVVNPESGAKQLDLIEDEREFPSIVVEEKIAPLTKEQQSELCGKWFILRSEDEATGNLIERVAIDQQVKDFANELLKSRDLEELAEVPLLLLSLISVHFRRGVLPTDRFSAYDQLIDYLTQEHPARRRAATLNASDPGYAPLRDREVRLTFSNIAFSSHSDTVISATAVLALVEGFLNSSEGLGLGLEKFQARTLAEQFARVAEGSSGLIIKQGLDSRSFLHRSLQEFLASFYVSNLPLKIQQQFIRDHLFEPRWREVVLGLLWNTKRPDDVESLFEAFLTPSETPTEEIYRAELTAEVAFGPFNYPTAKAKELATSILCRIQRHEWLPHRHRLLSHALQGLASARTRDLVRGKLKRWVYARTTIRYWWVRGLKDWPPTQDTIDLLFDLLNDDSFDVQRTAASILVGLSKEVANQLVSEFKTTIEPFRQAAILHGLNALPPTDDVNFLTQFARRSDCQELRIEAIRARVIRSLGDETDLNDLLNMGSGRLHKYGLSQDISDLLKRGWSNMPELKSACFNGLTAVQISGKRHVLDRLSH